MVHWIWLHDCMDDGVGDRYTAWLPGLHNVLHHANEMVRSQIHKRQDNVPKKETVGLRGFVRWIRVCPRLTTCSSHCNHLSNLHLLPSPSSTFTRRIFQPHDYLLDWQNFLTPVQLNASKLWWKNNLLYDILAETDVPVPLHWRPLPLGEQRHPIESFSRESEFNCWFHQFMVHRCLWLQYIVRLVPESAFDIFHCL